MAEEIFGQAPQEEVFDPQGWEETLEYRGEEPAEQEEQVEQEEHQEESETEQEYAEETPLLDSMREKNYDVSAYSSDDEFLAGIQSDWSQVNTRQQEIQQQMQWLQAQQQAQQVPQETVDEDDEYYDEVNAVPEFDPQWSNLVEQDESGRFVVRPEYMGSVDPGLAQKVNDYVEWRQQRSNSLIENPMDTLMDQGLEEYIEARIDRAINSNSDERQTQGNAESFVQEHRDALFVIDPGSGEPMVDPSTGDQMLSPFGDALNNAHVMLLEQGMHDPEQRHKIAVQLAFNQAGSPYQEEEEYDMADYEVPLEEDNEYHKEQYQEQPFSNGPTNPEYMPDGRQMPQDLDGMPQHNSLGSLATQLAVHKGFLQPK